MSKMNTKLAGCLGTFFVTIIFFIVLFAIDLIFAFPFMWLWNWLMPELFGLKVIEYWQAFGLMILCGMLFKSPTVDNNG